MSSAVRTDPSLPLLALFGVGLGALPVPFIPPRLLARVRGAVAYDIAARRGLCLTREAREELSRASLAVSGGAVLSTVLFIVRRWMKRVGAVGVVPPIAAGLEVYALGLLLGRYVERSRSSCAVRIDEKEAREIRHLIDHSIQRAVSLHLPAGQRELATLPTEDLRDLSIRVTDGVLLAVATLPTLLRRRLEDAFDAVVAETADKEPQRAQPQ
jgi:hypothetical protein